MDDRAFNEDLLDYLDNSPTPFHATRNLAGALEQAGFTRLDEAAAWSVEAAGRYFITRGDSALIAFTLAGDLAGTGIRMIGSHTDSPCLKLKPNAAFKAHGYWQLGVEVYGGVLLNPWFDRDLSLAGQVSIRHADGRIEQRLVDFARAIAIIPSLAIHLDREANENRAINKQTYLPAIVCRDDTAFDLHEALYDQLRAGDPSLADCEIAAFELSLYPMEKAAIVGLRGDFIASARLDNLLSCYVSVRALLDHSAQTTALIVCNDHEEVGSGSAVGARGPFLRSVLERLSATNEDYARTIAQSVLVSTDNAHGIHPNFSDRHDDQHAPVLNAGPAIKVNSNQAYASTNETIALFKHACGVAGVSVQSFVARADMGCGSTIGPLTASALGVRTVDVGVPTFAMHSIRELAGARDPHALYRALGCFLARA
ncbi:MAG: M18 family aminopeptidase [Gammaproteobacteria bacterium]|jgi:aspartyl aminopeptidase